MALASGGVHALGLGVPNTRAILGETLRMSVPLELEQGEDTDDGCPQAEVFYGESRLDAGKVILGVSPQSGRNRVITVRAIQPINEPLIDVTISYGCGARLSRKFTVFASPPEFVPTVVLSPATTSASIDGEGARVANNAAALPATVSSRATPDRAAVRDADAVPRLAAWVSGGVCTWTFPMIVVCTASLPLTYWAWVAGTIARAAKTARMVYLFK